MGTTDHDTRRARPESEAPDTARDATPVAADVAGDQPFGPHATQILATEHWSLLATRSLLWSEALSRATVFLTVLSAATIALALLADATGFGAQTTTLALVLLPVVLLLGVATYVGLVQINNEEFKLVLAMKRLRRAYLQIEPGLEPYFSTGHHDHEHGLVATYMLDRPSRRWLLVHFVINTPTIVATVDAALAAAIAVLVLQAADAPRITLVAGGVAAFLAVWGGLMPLQRHNTDPLRHRTPRFPTPQDKPSVRPMERMAQDVPSAGRILMRSPIPADCESAAKPATGNELADIPRPSFPCGRPDVSGAGPGGGRPRWSSPAPLASGAYSLTPYPERMRATPST